MSDALQLALACGRNDVEAVLEYIRNGIEQTKDRVEPVHSNTQQFKGTSIW